MGSCIVLERADTSVEKADVKDDHPLPFFLLLVIFLLVSRTL